MTATEHVVCYCPRCGVYFESDIPLARNLAELDQFYDDAYDEHCRTGCTGWVPFIPRVEP